MMFLGLSAVGSNNSIPLEIYSPEESPPLSFEENGKPQGLANEIVQEVQKRLGRKDEILIVPWSRAYQKIQVHPNVVFSFVGRTKEREQLFSMIGPIATVDVAFFGKKDSAHKISSLEDALKVERIAVRSNTVFEQILQKKGFKGLIPTQTILQNQRLLLSNRVDLFLDAGPDSLEVMKREKLNSKVMKKVFVLMDLDLYTAFSKGTSRQLIQDWKTTLQKIKADGTFERIYRKWLPEGKMPMFMEETHPPKHPISTLETSMSPIVF